MLYVAYGSNLSRTRMARRCPRAEPLSAICLKGWRLRFERVATLVPDPTGRVPAALYRLTEDCRRILDVVEGVDEGRYRRHWLPLAGRPGAGGVRALTYLKIDARRGPPSSDYLSHIVAGYRDWGHDAALPALHRDAAAEACR